MHLYVHATVLPKTQLQQSVCLATEIMPPWFAALYKASPLTRETSSRPPLRALWTTSWTGLLLTAHFHQSLETAPPRRAHKTSQSPPVYLPPLQIRKLNLAPSRSKGRNHLQNTDYLRPALLAVLLSLTHPHLPSRKTLCAHKIQLYSSAASDSYV